MQPETKEYAEYIGLDLLRFPELLWIAEEGLHCPLPDGWSIVKKENGHYFENSNGKTQTDHPMDDHYRRVALREVQHIMQRKMRETIVRLEVVEPLVESPPSVGQKIRASSTSTSLRFWLYLFVGTVLLHLCTSNLFFAPRPPVAQPCASQIQVREYVYVVQREVTPVQEQPLETARNETIELHANDIGSSGEQAHIADDEESSEGWWF